MTSRRVSRVAGSKIRSHKTPDCLRLPRSYFQAGGGHTMKKILGVAFAGLMLMACGSSNKSSTGMQGNTTASSQTMPGEQPNPTSDQNGGGSSIGSGQGNMAGSSTGPTGSGGNNSEQQSSQNSSPTNNP